MANTGNTQQQIDYGTSANDGTGDDLRVAFIKTDENFDNIWLAGPVGSNITITNNTVQVNNTNGNLILSPNGIGAIQTNSKLLPRLNNTYDLGSSTFKYRSVYVGAGGITTDGNLILNNVANLRIPGGQNGYIIQTDGDSNLSWVAMPGAGNGSPGGANLQVQYNANGLFGGSTNFTFNPATSNLSVGNTAVGNISTRTVYANIISVNTAGNTWSINNQYLQAPTGATWHSDTDSNDEYISSAVNGYINIETYDVTSNLATQLHLEHGLVHINIFNGSNYTWEFNDSGLFSAPANITANGNITANYFLGDGSQLTDLPGGVIQGNIPPVSPNDTTLWWDDVTGRLYVWYDDGSGLQWVDAAPAGPAVTYGNANVSSFLASGNNNANIVTTGNISAGYFLGNLSPAAGQLIAAQGGYITVGNLLVGQGGSLFNKNNDSWSLYGNLSDPGTTVFIPSNADAFNGVSLDITNTISNVNVQSGGSIWSFNNNSTIGFPTTDVGNLPAATTPGLRAFVTDANLVAAGNFGQTVGNAGSNIVPVYSDGSNWRIG